MIVIFIFYFNDRKAAVKQNRLFLYQSIAIFFSIFFDISSIIFINIPNMTYSFITYALCKLYLVSCLCVVFFALLYVLGDLPEFKRKRKQIVTYSALGVLIVFSILFLALPLNIVYDPKGLNDYTEGLPVILVYIGTFLFMTTIMVTAFLNRKSMYKKRFLAICIFISVWVTGSLVQAIFNYFLSDLGIVILSVSFTETLGTLAIYILLESPSFNIDRVTGVLNQRAFEDYLQTCYKKNTNVEFFVIEYDNVYASQMMGYNKFAKSLAELLTKYKANKVFKNDRNDFIVVRNKGYTRHISDLVMQFKDELYKKNNIITEIPFKIIYFGDISLFKNSVECLDAIEYLIDASVSINEQIIFVTPTVADEIHEKFNMQKKCDNAFAKKNIEVYYQPIYSNESNSFTSAEALVRMRDDEGNLIYPNDFVTDMEIDGRIIELGRIVFENVCRFISEHDMEKLGLHYIEVNLSAVQGIQNDLADTFIYIMKKYNVDPKYINLEITETAQSKKISLLKNMQKLKEYGVTFSLDDFGTGNSNLNYMIEMPVNIVKFDRNMVISYFENKIASFVMDSAINMIRGLGHKIVFEGVEEKNQIAKIKMLAIDYVQGYFYSKAINKDAFVDFILKNNNVAY